MLSLSRAVLFALLFSAFHCAFAQDYDREKRWENEITPSVVVGDPVRIMAASGHEFLALYAEAEKPRASIVIVHGVGVHPDHGVIGTLRAKLVEQGYNTLSIQMPVLASDASADAYPALFPDAADRIAKAAAWLKAKGQTRLVLLSHSMGSRMANAYFDRAGRDTPYLAWVALGLGQAYSEPTARALYPILDVYGEKDLPAVRDAAAQRKKALNPLHGSKQIVLARADHFYTGEETALVATVDNFLREALATPAQKK